MIIKAVMRHFFLALVLCALVAPAPAQNTKENADFKLAINLYNDKLYDLAQEQLKQFIAAYPTTSQGIEARFYLGLTQLQLKQYEDARITFQTFALTYQDNPRAPEAWWNVGEAHAALGSLKEAALAFERVKVFHPRSKNAPDALLRAAKLFAQAGERDNARRTLRVILQEYPTSTAVNAARTQLGQIYFDEGNLDLASNELKRVIEGDPSADARAQALLILANIHQEMGRFDQAKSAYQEIITTYKTPSAVQGAHLHLARLLTASGAYPEAIDNLKRALGQSKGADSTQTKDALLALGEAYLAAGDMQNASSTFARFVDTYTRDERIPDALMQLAYAASRDQRLQPAATTPATRLLKLNAPDALRREALLRLARNAREAGQAAAAVQHYTRYTELFPDAVNTPAVLFETARVIEAELSATCAARAPCTRSSPHGHARSAFGDDAAMGAARCYEGLKEFSRALELYRTFITLYPASDLRGDAEDRIRMIEAFEAKDKDARTREARAARRRCRAGAGPFRPRTPSGRDLLPRPEELPGRGHAVRHGHRGRTAARRPGERDVPPRPGAGTAELEGHRRTARQRSKRIAPISPGSPRDSRNQDALLSLFELSATSAAGRQAGRGHGPVDRSADQAPGRRWTSASQRCSRRPTASAQALALYEAIARQTPGTAGRGGGGIRTHGVCCSKRDSRIPPWPSARQRLRHSRTGGTAPTHARAPGIACTETRPGTACGGTASTGSIEEFPYTNAAVSAKRETRRCLPGVRQYRPRHRDVHRPAEQ